MAEQDRPPDSELVEISAEPKVAGTEGKSPAPQRRRPQPSRKPGLRPGPWNKVLKIVIEGISILVHGIPAVLAHVLGLVPENPVKALAFVGVLLILDGWFGMEHPKSEGVCFASMFALTVNAIVIGVVAVRNPGNDERLRQAQEQRVRAVGVKPFQYRAQAVGAKPFQYRAPFDS